MQITIKMTSLQFNLSLCIALALVVAGCNPGPPQLPIGYANLSDDDIMILFTKALGAMENDYSNPQEKIELLEKEVTNRKLARVIDLEKIRMVGRYADQGEAYIGMRARVLVALRGNPYNVERGRSSEKWTWGDGFVTSPNRYRTRDYVCVRDNLIVGVRYTYCDFGDCSFNKTRGEDC